MISGTYLISGSVLAFSAWLFNAGVLPAASQTLIWIVVVLFASAGASAGYLTVSEIFPIEIRAEAIAAFFAIAQIFASVHPLRTGHRRRLQLRRPDHRLPDRRRRHDHQRAGRGRPRDRRRDHAAEAGCPAAHPGRLRGDMR
jgi:hypothetical protein